MIGGEASKEGHQPLPKFAWLHNDGIEVSLGLMWVIKKYIGPFERGKEFGRNYVITL